MPEATTPTPRTQEQVLRALLAIASPSSTALERVAGYSLIRDSGENGLRLDGSGIMSLADGLAAQAEADCSVSSDAQLGSEALLMRDGRRVDTTAPGFPMLVSGVTP